LRAVPLRAKVVEAPLAQVQAEEENSIVRSDRQVKMEMKMMRTMIKRSTRMMRERMMKTKSTIVKIIEDDIYI
jgi:hypothetical protein